MIRFSSMISSFEERRVYRRTTSLCEFWFVMYIGTLQFLLHFILHDTLESPIIWLIMILARVCIALYLNQIGKLQGQLWKSSEWVYWIACGTLTRSPFWFYLRFHIPKALIYRLFRVFSPSSCPKSTKTYLFLLLLHVCFFLSNICFSQPDRI